MSILVMVETPQAQVGATSKMARANLLMHPTLVDDLRNRLTNRHGHRLSTELQDALTYLKTVTRYQSYDLLSHGPQGGAGIVGRFEAITQVGGRAVGSPSGTTLSQGYLGSRRDGGIDLDGFIAQAHPHGSGVEVAVVDGGWWEHPDLHRHQRVIQATRRATVGHGDHGTAVTGVLMSSSANGSGIRGIVPSAGLVLEPYSELPANPETTPGTTMGIGGYDIFEALAKAILATSKPGVLVVAVDAVQVSDQGFSPRLGLEAWKAGRALFHVADGLGIVPVVAAGNGYGGDLQQYASSDLYPSPAIVVGAGEPDGARGRGGPRCRESNQGPRVDLHSWGKQVATLSENGGFTDRFNGTSSATAIVAGAVAAVLSYLIGREYQPTSRQLRNLLVRHGYGACSCGIGPRPDLGEVGRVLSSIPDHQLAAKMAGYA